MASTQLFSQSGGIQLVSGNIFSGSLIPPMAGVLLKYSILSGASGQAIYINTPLFSGDLPVSTQLSGGILSSGGLSDGMEMLPGDSLFIPKGSLGTSGIQAIKVMVPPASSGGRLFWQPDYSPSR